MDLVLSLALRVGLLLYCLFVPGWAVLRATGFSTPSRLDRLLACLATGAASTSVTVTILLLVGFYYRPVVLLLLFAPLGYLVWSQARPAPDLRAGDRVTDGFEPPALDPIDRAVVVASAGFLLVYLLDAWTSPITWWDGLASWGKWAADWGRRTSSAHYVVGGYPQLVPRLVSVMYKVTGAHSALLPVDFFALHGFFVLFAAWFLFAGVRLTQLLGLPAWPVALAGLGSMQFREHAGAGTVDVLVCALVTTLLALYFGLRRGTWSARSEAIVLGAAACAVIFTKWTGVVGLLLLFIFDRASRSAFPLAPARESSLSRTVSRALAIAALGMVPFLVEQGASELRIGRWAPDPFEVNISLRQIPTLLSTDANLVYRGGDAGVRAGLVQLRFWNSYDVPATLRALFTISLGLCLAASLASWLGRAVLPLLVAYGAIWLYWSSYDQRNIFGLLPALALCASAGAAQLWRMRPRVLWQSGVAAMAGLFLLLAGGGLLKDTQARLTGLARGDRALPLRLEAMRGDVAAKVALFYPQLQREYQFIAALSNRTDATHVLVTYPLFRFFTRGAHALSLWPFERVRPGDVFASHEYHRPPDDPRWVLLSRQPAHRVWLLAPELRTVTVRGTEPGPGGARRLLYDLSRRDLGARGLAVWRATLPADAAPSTTAVFESADGLPVDQALVSTACDLSDRPGSSVQCSGVVGLSGDALANYRDGELAVGIETPADPARVTLTVAPPLPWPAAPPQSPASGPATTASARR